MTATEDRIVGCIVGGAIGDAAGGPYEGLPGPVRIDDSLAWHISDDTQLTLATCEAILDAGGVDPQSIARRFLLWFQAGRITGIGSSTLKAMRDLEAGAHWAVAGHGGEYAAGNGAAMRIAPLVFTLDLEDPSSRTGIRDVCGITHQNDEAYAGALAVALAIHTRSISSSPLASGLMVSVANLLPDTAVRDRILKLSSLIGQNSALETAAPSGSSGYVVESVPLALFIVEHVAAYGFEAVIHACI